MEFKSVLYMLVVVVATFEYGSADPGSQGYIYITATKALYKYHSEDTTWHDARAGCEREGATLFHPGSQPELEEVIRALNIPDIWINVGLTDSEARGTYKTLDGLPISSVFGKWYSGHPTPGDDRCVQLRIPSRELGTLPCSNHLPYICKIQEHVEKDVLTTAKEIKTVIANSSASIIGMIEATQTQVASQATALQSLSDSLANQATSAARKTEMMQREMAATHREITGIHQHSENQTILLTRLAESVGMLVEVTRNQTSSLTALMQRQVQALEKLQEDSDINIRSQQ